MVDLTLIKTSARAVIYTYGADFSHFTGSAVVVELPVPVIAGRLDRAYAHLLLVVVVVALLLADEQLVALAREVRGRLDDLIRGRRGGRRLRVRRGFPRRGLPRRGLVLLRQRGLLGFLLTSLRNIERPIGKGEGDFEARFPAKSEKTV